VRERTAAERRLAGLVAERGSSRLVSA
jgi:hypothetical protein